MTLLQFIDKIEAQIVANDPEVQKYFASGLVSRDNDGKLRFRPYKKELEDMPTVLQDWVNLIVQSEGAIHFERSQ